MFSLLDTFSRDKNKYAPLIYKALVFVLVDGYGSLDLRTEMLYNFIFLFKSYPTIPIQILAEPLLK